MPSVRANPRLDVRTINGSIDLRRSGASVRFLGAADTFITEEQCLAMNVTGFVRCGAIQR